MTSDVPEHIVVWSLEFLNNRKQFVKIGESVSNTIILMQLELEHHKAQYLVLTT